MRASQGARPFRCQRLAHRLRFLELVNAGVQPPSSPLPPRLSLLLSCPRARELNFARGNSEFEMKVDGACHCVAIAFEASIDPQKVRICHCADCQQLSGTAFRVMVPCAESEFHLVSGNPKIYIKVAESGRRRQQAFCGNCGSPIYATSDEPPGGRTLGIRVGVLRQRNELVPTRQYWFRSAVPWLPAMPNVVVHGTQ